MVDEEDEHRADHGADESRRLPRRVNPHRLAEERREDRADDTEQRGDDEPARIASRHQEFRDDADDQADNDCPDDAHDVSFTMRVPRNPLSRQSATRSVGRAPIRA